MVRMAPPPQTISESLQRSIIIASCLGIMITGMVIAGVCLVPYWLDQRQDSERDLQFAFQTGKISVEAYFAGVVQVATQIARRTHIRENLAHYSQGRGMSRQDLVSFIRPVYQDALADRTDLIGITLLDHKGALLVEVGTGAMIPWQSLSLTSRQEKIHGPIHLGNKTGIIVEKPILTHQGVQVGLALATFQVEKLRQILADGNRQEKTGQALLGSQGDAGVILFFPCHSETGESGQQSCQAALTPFFQQACRGNRGLAFLRPGGDMVTYGPITGTTFGMVIRKGQSALYATISRQLPLVAFMILAFIIFGVWLMAMLLRPLTGKIILHNEDLSRQIDDKTGKLQKELHRRRETESKLRDSEHRLRSLAGQLIATQEKERRRIYRELHDELGQSLTACKIRLRSLEKSLPPRQQLSHAACARIEELLDDMLTEIRRLCQDLSPQILEELGLPAALGHLLEEMHIPGILRVDSDLEPLTGVFSPEQEINIYRIVQEALGNIGKHAGAGLISLKIARENGRVIVEVWDDGKGFAPSETQASDGQAEGFGLTFMRERARLLRGSLRVESHRGAGTRVTLMIPLEKGE